MYGFTAKSSIAALNICQILMRCANYYISLIFSSEIRRSGRLRGLQPEYEGLDHTKRTRTPRKTQPQFLDLADTTANTSISLEELLKPRYTSYTSAVFAYFGFYDEAEIARRRSLRLQGLDPEFEGLTWGQR